MLQKLKVKRHTVGEMQDQTHLGTLFERAATAEVLHFIEDIEVDRTPTDDTVKGDLWDVERLDAGDGEDMSENEGGWIKARRRKYDRK